MGRYDGIACPVCGKAFTEEDTVTVCPVCGTPHHADCYRSLGHCAHEDWHATGKKFDPQEGKGGESSLREITCPRCGSTCPPASAYCNTCGASLRGQQSAYGRQDPYGGTRSEGYYGGSADQERMEAYARYQYGGMSPDEELTEGITVREYAEFIGPGSPGFLLRFRRLVRRNKDISLNLFFGIGSGFYLAYRKLYRLAVPLLIWMGVYLGLYVAVAFLLAQGMMGEITGAMTDMDQLYQVLETVSANLPQWLTLAYTCVRYSFIPILLALIFFGDRIYLNHCTKTLKKLKETVAPEELSAAIAAQGGVNKKVIIVFLVLLGIGFFLLPFVMALGMI